MTSLQKNGSKQQEEENPLKFPGYYPKKRKKMSQKSVFGLRQKLKVLELRTSTPFLD
jgi:hypothetical protein